MLAFGLSLLGKSVDLNQRRMDILFAVGFRLRQLNLRTANEQLLIIGGECR